jgi:broad specificity phosphatase PhoE
MPASRVHLIRHGEVFNPHGVLYERIDGFGLSELGHQMARAAAEQLQREGVKPGKLVVSPLQRAQESAAPIAELFGLDPEVDERVIEPWNLFRGLRLGPRAILKRPSLILNLHSPTRPSWGEPFAEIAQRMHSAALDHAESVEDGDVVIVSHQLPIWMLHRSAKGLRLPHNPSARRCSLSSITSFEIADGALREIDYREPGIEFASMAKDGGAV